MAVLRLSREQLAKILGNDFEAIRQFEQLFTMTTTNEVEITATRTLAELTAYGPDAPLGSLGVQSADNVDITGGSISGIAPPIDTASGGTGQSSYTDGELLIGKTDGTLAKTTLTAGTAISVTNGDGAVTVTNDAPDQIVTLTAGTNIGITGTYPSFTINATDAFTGTVTSVDVSGGTTGLTTTGGPVTTSGTITLGGTLAVTNGGTGTATTFTAGSIVFAGASGVYSQDNANLHWDDANNRLGIGTASPAFPLEVSGEARADKFTSLSGAQNLADATLLTIATLTGVAPRSYIVTFAVNIETGANMTVAVVTAGNDGLGGPSLSVVDLQNGATTEVAVAGGNIQVRQTTGTAQDVTWSITRLM